MIHVPGLVPLRDANASSSCPGIPRNLHQVQGPVYLGGASGCIFPCLLRQWSPRVLPPTLYGQDQVVLLSFLFVCFCLFSHLKLSLVLSSSPPTSLVLTQSLVLTESSQGLLKPFVPLYSHGLLRVPVKFRSCQLNCFFLTQISSHFLLLYLALTLQSEWWFYNVGHLQYLLISKSLIKAGSVLWASFPFHLLLHMLYSPGIIPTSFSVEASWGFCVCFLVFCPDPPLINSSRYCVQLRHGFHLTFSSLHLIFEFYPPLIQSLDITITNSPILLPFSD